MSGNRSIPTPTSEDTWRSIRRLWLRCLDDRSYRRKKCIIETGRGTIIAVRILSYGLEGGNHPELESAT